MQAAIQESGDAGISKTINFRNEATEEEIDETYMLAWELKCKGITVYREGSREGILITNEENTETKKLKEDAAASSGSLTHRRGHATRDDEKNEIIIIIIIT